MHLNEHLIFIIASHLSLYELRVCRFNSSVFGLIFDGCVVFCERIGHGSVLKGRAEGFRRRRNGDVRDGSGGAAAEVLAVGAGVHGLLPVQQ